MTREWPVRAGDGATLREILACLGEGEGAVAEGRVFLNRARARDAEAPVSVGDVVSLGALRDGEGELSILYEGDGLVVVDKPVATPTVPDRAGAAHALSHLVARHAGVAPERVRVTSRLDLDVSGVVVFALDEAAQRVLDDARIRGTYSRRYVALASGLLERLRGEWTAPIGRARSPKLRAAFGPDAKASRSDYLVVGSRAGISLLALAPRTGRTHQLRVHAAHAGAPLLGDGAYGGPRRVVLDDGDVLSLRRIALHAARVTVPTKGGVARSFDAPIPDGLRAVWARLGGAGDLWDTAVSCTLE